MGEGNKCAFTLAEVLITLVIIGVIAAITVPTLINKTQNQEYVSKLKKTYSTLAQATNLIIAEEGTPKASVGGWASSPENIYNLYKKHLNNAKECGTNSGCFEGQTEGYKYLNLPGVEGKVYNQASDNRAKLILSDGVQVLFTKVSDDCNSPLDAGSQNVCARIYVDLNGAKNPNIIGRDFFTFVIKENGLYPRGCDGNNTCNATNSAGWGCACKVLREGAMNY